MSAGLRLESVALSFGARDVICDVSLEVQPGEVVGLLGRNGAGKTTLLKMASGALAPSHGSVTLAERDIADYSRREFARKLAVVPQDTTVAFPFSVIELVLMGRAPHQPLVSFEGSSDFAIAREAMERVGIGDLAERTVTELSGGERQLVTFARALAQEPEFLLLDEPTAFLDLRHRMDVMSVVRGLADAGAGALVVSHDITLAARACDRLVLLADGKVAAAGAPADVLTREHIERVFEIAADVLPAPDGLPVVVPRLT